MIKLIALDIDDTLLCAGKPVSSRNCAAIAAARAKGVKVVIATGRGFKGSAPVREQLHLTETVINYGGALVSDGVTGEPLFAHYMAEDEVRACFAAADAYGLHAQIYNGDEVIFRAENAFTKQYCGATNLPFCVDPDLLEHDLSTTPKVLLYCDPSVQAEMMEKVGAMLPPSLHLLTSKAGFLEIGSNETDKATALAWIAKHYGIEREEVCAIGDNTLDLGMIRWAGVGCCVANGAQIVKDAADLLLPSCADDGVAYYIETEILKS